MLPYERVDDAERLTRTGRTQHDSPTERVDDVDPAPVHLLFPVIYHGNVHRVVVVYQHFRLLEGFVLEVETVFAHLVVVIPGDAVQPLMHQHGACHRAEGIEDTACRETHPADAEVHPVKDKTQPDKGQSRQYRVDDHRPDVELQRLLRLRTYTHHTDADQFRHLAARHRVEHLETSQYVKNELRDAVVRRYRQVHHDLDDEKDVDTAMSDAQAKIDALDK